MRRSLVTFSVLLALAGSVAARPAAPPPLPQRMADTGGGTQLITAEAPAEGSTTGTVTWWNLRRGVWVKGGSTPARFGARGLAEGASRKQGTNTTPTGLYDLPYAFGIKPAPGPAPSIPTAGSTTGRGGARTTRRGPTTAGWSHGPRTAGRARRNI